MKSTRLVAERAFARRLRSSAPAPLTIEAADRDYREKSEGALEDRFEGLKSPPSCTRTPTRRRGITDASIASEDRRQGRVRQGQPEDCRPSSTPAREQARGDFAKGQARAMADFDSGEKHAGERDTPTARKPIDDATKLIESRKRTGWPGAVTRTTNTSDSPKPPQSTPPRSEGRPQDRGPARARSSTGSRSSSPTWPCSKAW